MKFVAKIFFGSVLVFSGSLNAALACGEASVEAELDALRLDAVVGDTAPQTAEEFLQTGITHFNARRYDLAEDAFRSSRQLAKRDRKIETQISATTNLANVLTRQGKLLDAERQFHRAIKLADRSGSWRLKVSALYNLGILYKERHEPNRAERIYQRALAALDGREAPRLHTATLNNLGNILRERGQFRRAERVLKHSLKLSESYGDEHAAKMAAQNLSKLYSDDYGLNGETGLAYRRSITPTKQTSRRGSPRTF